MKKLLTSIVVAGFMFSSVAAFACEGPDCGQVVDDASPKSQYHGEFTIVPSPGENSGYNLISDPDSDAKVNGNLGTADVTLMGRADAAGGDYWSTERQWVYGPYTSCWFGRCKEKYGWHKENVQVFNEGTAEAYGMTSLDNLTSDVEIITNGFKYNTGLSYSHVTGTTTLGIEGEVWAKGDDGCLQEAYLDVNGSLSALGYATSYSEGPNGAYALAGGIGMTTVSFDGYEYDSSIDPWIGPNKAYVDFDSEISVSQEVFTASYVSKDETTAANLAFVGGGYASSQLGRDGLFGLGRDDIQLTGITASGRVGQVSKAVDGGAKASGSSHAFFSGANGSIETIPGGCISASPGQTANVGGYAVVAGYNNVDVQGNSVTVTSVQYAKSTTGNTAPNMDNIQK